MTYKHTDEYINERLEAGEKAIDLSIESWERKAKGKEGYSCALCLHYHNCLICPYMKHSDGCWNNTPYMKWSHAKIGGAIEKRFAKQVLAGLKMAKKRMIEEGEY